ncbi:hypothetical protein [Desulfocurvus sp. DL9XJH121]
MGFIKDASQCPQRAPRVYLRRHGLAGPPTIRAWSDKRASGVELRWEAAGRDPRAWADTMAATIADLGWRRWWLDTQSLAEALGAPTAKALADWGMAFWPCYRKVASVYLRIGDEGREATAEVVRTWEKAFTHVRFNERLDIHGIEARRIEELRNKPVRRTLAKVLPALFKSL